MKAKNRKMLSNLSLVLIILYVSIIIYFTLLSDRLGRLDPYGNYRYNLIPFAEIRRYITYRDMVSPSAFFINIVGNIIVFMPFGFLVPIWIPGKSRWYHIIFYSLALTLGIESLQLISHVGVFDVDDIIMNTLGGLIGWICYCIINSIRKNRRNRRS